MTSKLCQREIESGVSCEKEVVGLVCDEFGTDRLCGEHLVERLKVAQENGTAATIVLLGKKPAEQAG